MIKVGLLGVGHLGKIHLKCWQEVDGAELIGFFDPDPEVRRKVSDLKAFDTYEQLIQASDVVDIVSPTTTHFELAAAAIRQGKHVFIEKPLAQTPEEGAQLQDLVKEFGVKVQVGHVERFNPALLAISDMLLSPMFVEGHRLATFNPRGTDVSVVLDLMIHDLDIILSLIPAEVVDVRANGVAIVSHQPDICNARLEFANGCVVNLTASRISLKQMRKLRLFQPDAYISLDFYNKETQVVRLFDERPSEDAFELDTQRGKKFIRVAMPEVTPNNAIQSELSAFIQCIREDRPPEVGISDGLRAIELAYRIIHEMERHAAQLSS